MRSFPPETQAHVRTVNAGHGRVEIRTLYTTDALNDYLNWPAVGQAVCVDRLRIGKQTGEILTAKRCFFVTSLNPERADPHRLLALCRQHWTIENKAHYVRDVTFHEDASQVRTGALPQVMAAFRNVTLSALRRLRITHLPTAFINNAARPFGVLAFLCL